MFLRLLIVRPLARDALVERPQGAFAVNILQIYVHSARVREKATAVALHAPATVAKRLAVNTLSTDQRIFVLTVQISLAPSFRSGRQGCFREALLKQVGIGVLRVCLASKPPGDVRATPPSRHYERDVRMHQCETEGHAHVHRPEVRQGGLGANKPPRGAPRGERPPAARTA